MVRLKYSVCKVSKMIFKTDSSGEGGLFNTNIDIELVQLQF